MLDSTLRPAEPDTGDALVELARFFAVAADNTQMCPMFSTYIDQAWHTLLSTPDPYAQFSREACDQVLGHRESLGMVGFPGSPTMRPALENSLRCGSPIRLAQSTRPRTPPTARPARSSTRGTAARSSTTNKSTLASATPDPGRRGTG